MAKRIERHPERYDVALEILQLTSDGNGLHSWQLKLVEDAVNGFLNELGYMVLELLAESCREGTWKEYTSPEMYPVEKENP